MRLHELFLLQEGTYQWCRPQEERESTKVTIWPVGVPHQTSTRDTSSAKVRLVHQESSCPQPHFRISRSWIAMQTDTSRMYNVWSHCVCWVLEVIWTCYVVMRTVIRNIRSLFCGTKLLEAAPVEMRIISTVLYYDIQKWKFRCVRSPDCAKTKCRVL
jgi:hypothetical protein